MAVPADPKRPYKAYVATALAGLSVFVAAWVADTDPFTTKEIVAALVAAVIGSGITGGATFAVKNPPVEPVALKKDTGWKNEAGEAYLGLIIGVLLILILVVVLLRVL